MELKATDIGFPEYENNQPLPDENLMHYMCRIYDTDEENFTEEMLKHFFAKHELYKFKNSKIYDKMDKDESFELAIQVGMDIIMNLSELSPDIAMDMSDRVDVLNRMNVKDDNSLKSVDETRIK